MLQLFKAPLTLLLVVFAGCETTNTSIVTEHRSSCVRARIRPSSDNADDDVFSMGTVHLHIKQSPSGQAATVTVRQGSDLNSDGILQDNEVDPDNLITSRTPGSEVTIGAITNHPFPPGPKLQMIRVIKVLDANDRVMFSVNQVAI